MFGNCLLFLLLYTAAALKMTGPSTYTARVGSIAHIPCTFTADKLPADPKYFAVVWNFGGKQILLYDNTITTLDARYSLDKDRALYGIADLTITDTSVSDTGEYTCSVINSPLRMETNIRVDITATPSITIVNKVVTKSIKSNLNSTIFGFYPVDIDIKWLRDGEILNNFMIEEPQRDPNRMYSVRSSVTITPTEEDRERIFTCRVQHVSLSSPLQKDFQLVFSVQPQLSIVTKSVQRNRENILTCMASGYFPADIIVTWYKDGETLNNQLMGEPHKNNNGTYQVISTLTITPSDDDENRKLSCRVQHLSLQEPLQEGFTITFEDSSFKIIVIILGVVLAVTIVAITGIIVYVRKCKRRKGKQKLSSQENGTQNSEFQPFLQQNQNRRLPDLKIGEITVPELTAGKIATLLCKLHNYINGKHSCSWYVRLKSGDEIEANYNKKKEKSINKDETSGDQNSYIAYLALLPVEESDDGSEFILRVTLQDVVIGERRTQPVRVTVNPWSPLKKKNESDARTEGKDQPVESSIAENSKPQPCDREPACEPAHQPQCPVVEEEDSNDNVTAKERSSSQMEPSDEEKCSNVDETKAENLIEHSPDSPNTEENAEDLSLQTNKDQKEQIPESEKQRGNH